MGPLRPSLRKQQRRQHIVSSSCRTGFRLIMLVTVLCQSSKRGAFSVWGFSSFNLHNGKRYQFLRFGPTFTYVNFLTEPKDPTNVINSHSFDAPRRCPSLTKRFISAVPFSNDKHDVEFEGVQGSETETSGTKFRVTSQYSPMGDQPQAIERLVAQVKRGDKYSVLQGITGTGKTFVMAHTIARVGKPALVLCHNKTLAAQLARELRSLLRKNHVQLFVSYYNHYVPESYNEVTACYKAKKSSVNNELDALRHMATKSLLEHEDVVVVASVSCIFGLGMPKAYLDATVKWTVGDVVGSSLKDVENVVERLLYVTPEECSEAGMTCNDLNRGNYQWSLNSSTPSNASSPTNGVSLMIWPMSHHFPIRVDFERKVGRDQSEWRVANIYHGHYSGIQAVNSTTIFPAKHHISGSADEFEESLARIHEELQARVKELRLQSKHEEADRLSRRVGQDLLLLRETGSCPGVENYSRHLALREKGVAPDTLLDYFGFSANDHFHAMESDDGGDWLLIVDESHVTLPQLKAMYRGDKARKEKLVKHGFRLPSALDNRPLRYEEFWERVPQTIFVSATPGVQELEFIRSQNVPVEMLIRPTYVLDPEIVIRPTNGQLDDLLREIQQRARKQERTLAITLTKRESEDLSNYLIENGVSSLYIHSGLNAQERSHALKALQIGEIDCLVGVNLLREGLDLPQVSLVAILNADSEGFLRSETALLQTIGRAARNLHGSAILYANRITQSMKKCIEATESRRRVQLIYNSEHGTEMKSTEGSTVQSIFDLLKDQIEAEKPIQVVRSDRVVENNSNVVFPVESHQVISLPGSQSSFEIDTDHLPSKPGVYFWKDGDGNVLYIGKAKRLRSRVKSYLAPNAMHNTRIRTMLSKAKIVEFILTPSDRDALILENKLIKHHSPLYNVLLKDDESYPYICATVGDALPQFNIVPRRIEGERAAKYKYYGPYTSFSEINHVLQGIEERFDLRSKSFQTRFGAFSKNEYQKLFYKALNEVFESNSSVDGQGDLVSLRKKYEEASMLFESKHNHSRDVVAVAKSEDGSTTVVYVLQLRGGMITGQFFYTCELACDLKTEHDFADVIQSVLEQRHYLSGGSPTTAHSFFPDEILTQYPLPAISELKTVIRVTRQASEPEGSRNNLGLLIRKPATRGARKESDARVLSCAIENAIEKANEQALVHNLASCSPRTSVDGTAIKELAAMLSLEKEPYRIECYDISHTQGTNAVGSRVVFIDGKPAPHLYRTFNIKDTTGPDDYKSLAEVLERRFARAWSTREGGGLVDDSDPWSVPDLVVIDGGKGQLSAALKGMSRANVLPAMHFVQSFDDGYNDDTQLIIADEIHPVPAISAAAPYVRVPVVALAKRNEEVFVNSNPNPVNNSTDSSALLLLRALRDESHRVSLYTHRKRRKKMNGL